MHFLPEYPLETARLLLRPFVRGDVDAVHAYRSREDVTRFMFDAPLSREACAEAVQLRVGQVAWSEECEKIFLAVERREDNAMIGEVLLILRDAASAQAELGYTFHPDFHGRGYATEASARLLALAFDDAAMHRVYARCHAHNVASRRVMERLGMRQEAHFREHRLVKGAWDSELLLAILEDEWRAGPHAAPPH